jgi:hypothetical protein
VALVVLGGGFMWQHERMAGRAELERAFPTEPNDAQAKELAAAVATWRAAETKLATAVKQLPPIDSLGLDEPCALANAPRIELMPNDGDYPTQVRDNVDAKLADLERDRFRSPGELERILLASHELVQVVTIEHEQAPKLHASSETRGVRDYTPGERSGGTYLFDAQGRLVCAGRFEARSSDEIHYGDEGMGNPSAAVDELARDLNRRTREVVGLGLRRVR